MHVPIQLIVGLGNPGPDYANTRHNAGAWLVEALAKRDGQPFRREAKFLGQCCVVKIESHACRLLLPTTYMNRSGQAVKALASFYQIPAEAILVAHDDLDLPPGVARLKRGGGDGGHNGLRDITAHLGTRDFVRLRLGIGHPGQSREVLDYVLGRPGRDDHQQIEQAITAALVVLPTVVKGDLAKAMNQLHSQ